jgi:hypothetical protein
MRKATALAAMSLLCATGIAAQHTPAPKPGPEHQKLAYFVGTWTSTGEMKPSPFGPGGKMSYTETCEWFEGRFSVVCRSQGTAPPGPTRGLAIMSYNTEAKAYTYYGIDNSPMNMASVPKGTVEGDTWTFTDESTMGGKQIKSRFTIRIASPTSYSFGWETEQEPGKWASILEGTATKKGAAK